MYRENRGCRDIHNKVNVIAVPTTFYGERIHPGSVKLVDNAGPITVDLRDDRDGNLYDQAYSSSYASYKVNGFDISYLTAEFLEISTIISSDIY